MFVGAVTNPKLTVILALLCIKKSQRPHTADITDDDICTDPGVHSEVAKFLTYTNLISGGLCALCVPQLLRLSDRYGRKKLLILSTTGMLLGDLISCLAALIPSRFPVIWILLEFVIGGLTGGFATTLTLIQLHIADCVSKEERAKAFSQSHACMYLGMALGPALGAWIIRFSDGHFLPAFGVAGVGHLMFAGYICFALPAPRPNTAPKILQPESEATQSTATARVRRLLRLCNIAKPLQILISPTTTTEPLFKSTLLSLAAIDALAFGIQLGLPALLVLYSEFQFGWKSFETNLFLSLINFFRAIFLWILLPMLVQDTVSPSTTDEIPPSKPASVSYKRGVYIIRFSILLEGLGQCGFAASTSSTLFSISGVVVSLGSFISPVAQATMTQYVESGCWGQLFGATSLLHSIARAFVPALMQTMYGLSLPNASGVLFFGLASTFFALFMLSLGISERSKEDAT